MCDRFLDVLGDGAAPLAIVAGEFEILLKEIFEPDLMVAASFIDYNTMTVWGAIKIDPYSYQIEIYRPCEPEYDWSHCPRKPGDRHSIIMLNIKIDSNGLAIYDECYRQRFIYQLEDPECFEKMLQHVWFEVECKLVEVQTRMELIIDQQEASVEFDGYGDLGSQLAVLREKRRLFAKRYEAVEL